MLDNLLEQFLANAKIHFEIDYSDKKSVRRGNTAVANLFEIADKIQLAKRPSLFDELLRINEFRADLWIAHILLERLGAQDDFRTRALEIIEHYAASDGAESSGERMWLEQWRVDKPQ